MKENTPKLQIIKRELITDHSDPRMMGFRKLRGEFEPGCKQKTVRLEIAEYKPGPDGFKVTTQIGYYEGEPPLGYREFFRRFYQQLFNKAMQDRKAGNGGYILNGEIDLPYD